MERTSFPLGLVLGLLATGLVSQPLPSVREPLPSANDNESAASIAAVVKRSARFGDWVQSGAGTGTRSIDSKLQDQPISLLDFPGVDRTGARPVDAAWTAFVSAMQVQRRAGYVPSGRYRFARQAVIDLAPSAGTGFVLACEGENNTILDVSGAPQTAPQFLLKVSEGRPPSPATFYIHISKCGIQGNTPQTVMAIGDSGQVDQVNGAKFDDLWVANADSSAPSAAAVEINAVFNSSFRMTVNGGASRGQGDAVRIRGAQFSQFFLAAGHARCALALRGGYSFGNTFLASDFEEVTFDVCIDSPNASRNTWIGGQFAYGPPAAGEGPYGGIDARAGVENLFVNANIAPSHGAREVPVVNGIGVALLRGSGVTSATSVPAAWNLTSAGGTLQLQIGPDGVGYLSNHAAGKPLAISSPGGVAVHGELRPEGGIRLGVQARTCTGRPTGTLWIDDQDGRRVKACP